MAAERLQKLIARAGLASRRKAEEWILAGRVRVNGRVVKELGVRADFERDRVEVDGRRLVFQAPVTYVLHKPQEVVTTLADPEGRRTVLALIRRIQRRVVPVGRLDFRTSGALLLTSDGELANGLLHPRRNVPRVYRVKVKGRVRDDVLARWAEGIEIDGRPTRPADVVRLRESADNVWIGLTLYEGRYHQVHRMCEATGLRLMRLARISFAGITVEGLRPGEYRQLDRREVAQLRKLVAQPEPRTRLAPPPPGLDDLPESHRGEEDDGAWAAWNEGTLWELLGEPSGAAPGSAVASGVVRRRPDAGDGQRADRWFPMSEDRPAPLRGRLEGEFEDDEWESGEGPEPESRGAGGKVPPPAESRPRREVEGRRGRAFAPGPARGSRPGKPRG